MTVKSDQQTSMTLQSVNFAATDCKCVRSDDSYSDIWNNDIKRVANISKKKHGRESRTEALFKEAENKQVVFQEWPYQLDQVQLSFKVK